MAEEGDPRRHITIENLMRMTSGLGVKETNSGMDDASRMIFAERDMAGFAVKARLEVAPGPVVLSAIHWLVVAVPRDWSSQFDGADQKAIIDGIANVAFASKATIPIPKIPVVNDDVDIFNLKELVWAFVTRNHPCFGELISPLVAFYHSSEKASGHGLKVVYNLMAPEEWGDELPTRSNFALAYPIGLQQAVVSNWLDYGFRSEDAHRVSQADKLL